VFNQETPIKIPKEFTLLGHKYTVILDKELFANEQCYGTADDDLKLIRIQDVGTVTRKYEEDGKQVETEIVITERVVIETFFHELTHIILDALGEEELSGSEKFVNLMGKAWLEVYLYSVYEKYSK
jgi:hypothetical protein